MFERPVERDERYMSSDERSMWPLLWGCGSCAARREAKTFVTWILGFFWARTFSTFALHFPFFRGTNEIGANQVTHPWLTPDEQPQYT